MEVKPGYKQTEVGVIPKEWDVRTLPEVSWFQEGPGLRNWQFTSTGMKVINVTNLEDGVLNLERTDRHISVSEFNQMYQHFAVDAADIVMASSGNSYSKTAVVRQQDLPLVMNTSVIRFKPSKACDYGFLWALLNSPLFKSQIDLMITGGAQPNFGPHHLKRLNVPVPPLPEQRAIAAALSDMDALLDALDRLIAKKRDLKQAAMQQLLTGQTRLPGFHGDWEVKRLGDVIEKLVGGGTPSRGNQAFWGKEIPWVTVKDFATFHPRQTQESITRVGLNNSASHLISAGTLITSTRMALGKAVVYEVDVAINQDLKALFLKPSASIQFLYYWFEHNAQMIDDLGSGSTVKGISIAELRGIPFPHLALPEQTAIAAVLTDMDAELAALEQRLAKTRALKQGMMQELLTGRTRLV